jgi:hypothetical protein
MSLLSVFLAGYPVIGQQSKEKNMPEDTLGDRKKLTKSVKKSLRKAEGIISGYKKTNSRLLVTTIVSSSASTLVAGVTAALGPVVGSGVEGWRAACIIVAIFGFVSTVSIGLSQQLKITDRLSDGKQGVGKLRYLDVVITTRSKNWEEIIKEYEGIAKAHPELII